MSHDSTASQSVRPAACRSKTEFDSTLDLNFFWALDKQYRLYSTRSRVSTAKPKKMVDFDRGHPNYVIIINTFGEVSEALAFQTASEFQTKTMCLSLRRCHYQRQIRRSSNFAFSTPFSQISNLTLEFFRTFSTFTSKTFL